MNIKIMYVDRFGFILNFWLLSHYLNTNYFTQLCCDRNFKFEPYLHLDTAATSRQLNIPPNILHNSNL